MIPILLLAAFVNGDTVRVPQGSTPTVDGRIASGEWDAAAMFNVADGTAVLLQHDGADVYVALRAAAEVLGSLCVHAGDRVHVLHASMALARASYRPVEGGWRLESGFDYTLREVDFSPEALAKRERHYDEERWVANTTGMGEAHVREYRIARELLTGDARLAVAYMRRGADPEIGSWPDTGADGCSARDLVMGHTPEPLQFQPAAWLILVLEPASAATQPGGRATSGASGARAVHEVHAARMDAADAPGELLATSSPPVWFEGFATAAVVSPDGRRAIVGSSGSGDLRVLDLTTRLEEPVEPLEAGLQSVSAAVFDARGRVALLGTSPDGTGWFLRYGSMTRPLAVPADALPHWSPDGERVAYYRRLSPERGLTIMEADREHAIHVDGTVTALAWTHDGSSVLVLAADSTGVSALYRVRLATSAAELLVRGLDAPVYGRLRPMAVAPDGRRVYVALASADAPDPRERHQPVAERDLDIYEIDLTTGARRAIVATPADEYAPAVIGGHLYWTVSAVQQDVVVLPAAGGAARVVVEDAMLPTWRRDGRALGFTFGQWRQADWVLNWDGGTIEVDADAKPVATPMPYITGYHEDFSPVWSPDGQWVAYHSHRSGDAVAHYHGPGSTDDIFLRRAGSTDELRLTDFGLEVGPPSWAPDGRRLVFTGWLGGPGRSGAWITTLDPATGSVLGHRLLELPDEIGGAANATWSPVADIIAVSAPAPRGQRALWTVRTDGSPIRHVIDYPLMTYGGVDWTPDGSTLVFPAIDGGRMQLFAVPAAHGGESRRLTDDTANLLHPVVSPDGRWIAATRITHRRELRRMPLP
jgi:Tol biopolymer transport system component